MRVVEVCRMLLGYLADTDEELYVRIIRRSKNKTEVAMVQVRDVSCLKDCCFLRVEETDIEWERV